MTIGTFESIRWQTEGATAIVTLHRPERRNALSLGLMLELTACLEEIGGNR
jgi:enoyl-CoA hydratase/carnithine racemase